MNVYNLQDIFNMYDVPIYLHAVWIFKITIYETCESSQFFLFIQFYYATFEHADIAPTVSVTTDQIYNF